MDEIDCILDMGVDIRYNSPVDSMSALLDEGFDAVFVGSGAPRGKDLDLPGRHDTRTEHIHIGIDWLGSVAFGHIDTIGERVLIIGVGNTAMDCCRSSRRLGGKDIKVMARRPRAFFKASPWELEDAEEEGVEIVINHAPKRFVIENGKLTGMEFERLEWDAEAKKSKVIDTVILPCDDVILAIGQDNAFPWIERDLGIEFDKWDMPKVDEMTFDVHPPRRLLRRRCRLGTEEHHLGRRTRPSGRHLHPQPLPGDSGDRAPAARHESHQPEDGPQRVELSQRLQSVAAPEDAARRSGAALRGTRHRSRARLHRRTDRARSAALPELRYRDRLHRAEMHRVRRLHRYLSRLLPHDRAGRAGRSAPPASLRAGHQSRSGALRLQTAPPNRPPHVEGRRPLRPLRPVRGALSHRGVGHAEIPDFSSSYAGHGDHAAASNNAQRHKRFCIQAGERQRVRLGQRQQPPHAGHLPDGRSRLRQEPLPVEYSGPAHVV